jgi:hypothetical protein
MRNTKTRAGPLGFLLCFVCIALMALPGCLSVHEYEENSHLHSMQAERNASGANNGMNEVEIDAVIVDAWRYAKGLPDDAEVDSADLEFQSFRDRLLSYALTDIEVEIDVDQARAWVDYEDAKRPPDRSPPTLED